MRPTKLSLRASRKRRIRAKVSGTAERPRLSVTVSLMRVSVQLIDDTKGKTLAHAVSAKGKNIAAATKVGQDIAKKAKDLYMDKDKWHSAVAQFAVVTTCENVAMLIDNKAKWDCLDGVKTHGLFSNYLTALKLQRVNRAWQARIAGDQKKLGMQNP